MKYTWTESDIVAGRVVCKQSEYHHGNRPWEPSGGAMKWTMKIGYLPSLASERHFCLIALTDGMISCEGVSKAELVERLNKDEMIPMPHPWLLEVMDALRDCYEHEFRISRR